MGVVLRFGILVLLQSFVFDCGYADDSLVFDFVADLFTEKTCEKLLCLDTPECSNGFIDDSGCCPVCKKFLEEGEPCADVPKLPGGKEVSVCRPGLFCSEDGVCQIMSDEDKKKNSCLERKKRREYLLTKGSAENIGERFGLLSREAWIPQCDETGDYIPKQCKGKKCVCVDELGETIYGQMESELAQNMTCACSRKMTALSRVAGPSWMSEPQIHCTTSGDYDPLQCEGDICYCVDEQTGKPKGRLVSIKQFTLLPCYDEKKHGDMYLKECEKELVRARFLVHQFSKKGIDVVGLEHADCDLDGNFAKRQCNVPEKCVCSSREGKSLKSYGSPDKSKPSIKEMNCNCAMDEYDFEENHLRYPQLTCGPNGNFAPYHCTDDDCLCIEKDGAILREIEQKTSPDDESSIHNTIRELCSKDDQTLCEELNGIIGESYPCA